MLGSARMMDETETDPAELRAEVTSPGGTTTAGLRSLELKAVRSAFIEAVAAATERSRQLAAGDRRIPARQPKPSPCRLLRLRLRHGRRVRRRRPRRSASARAGGTGHRPLPRRAGFRRRRRCRPSGAVRAGPRTGRGPRRRRPGSRIGAAGRRHRPGRRRRRRPDWLVGPDNGLLLPLAAVGGIRQVREIDAEAASRRGWPAVAEARTFDGRDLFAPAAAHLVSGGSPEALGPIVEPGTLTPAPAPARPDLEPDGPPDGPGPVGVVKWVDRFGNVQLDLGPADLDAMAVGLDDEVEVEAEVLAGRPPGPDGPNGAAPPCPPGDGLRRPRAGGDRPAHRRQRTTRPGLRPRLGRRGARAPGDRRSGADPAGPSRRRHLVVGPHRQRCPTSRRARLFVRRGRAVRSRRCRGRCRGVPASPEGQEGVRRRDGSPRRRWPASPSISAFSRSSFVRGRPPCPPSCWPPRPG